MPNLSLTDWMALIGVYLTILGAFWGFSKYLNERFSAMQDKLDKFVDKLLEKLEYHERHDDTRFATLQKELWELRLRNAAMDARFRGKVFDQENNHHEDQGK